MTQSNHEQAAAFQTYWRSRCVAQYGPHRLVVDGFVYGMEPRNGESTISGDDNAKTTYILTHFHSDHYMGIRSHFNRGAILCTYITAQLLVSHLGVSKGIIKVLELARDYCIDLRTGDLVDSGGDHDAMVHVQLVDANHCPGAAMVILRHAGKLKIHTGDFRFGPQPFNTPCRALPLSTTLAPYRSAVDTLYLDNTFCDPRHVFPTQEECVERAVSQIADKLRRARRALVAFGSYTIGKEIFAFGFRDRVDPSAPVFAAPSKVRSLDTCGFVERCNIRALPSGTVTADALCPSDGSCVFVFVSMEAIRSQLGGQHDVCVVDASDGCGIGLEGFDCVVGIEPTGWNAAGGRWPRQDHDQSVQSRFHRIAVPYSEHCSWSELLDFVGFLNPRDIVPTVDRRSFERYESVFREQASRFAPRIGSTPPITAFFTRRQPTGAHVAGGPTGASGSVPRLKRDRPMEILVSTDEEEGDVIIVQ